MRICQHYRICTRWQIGFRRKNQRKQRAFSGIILRGGVAAEHHAVIAVADDRSGTVIRREIGKLHLFQRQRISIPEYISQTGSISRIRFCRDRDTDFARFTGSHFSICSSQSKCSLRCIACQRDHPRSQRNGNRLYILVKNACIVKLNHIIPGFCSRCNFKFQREEFTCFCEIFFCIVVAEHDAIAACIFDRGGIIILCAICKFDRFQFQRGAVP